MTAPGVRPHTPAQLVRLVAGREISTRIRDKGFLVGSAVLIVLILGMLVFQVAINSGTESFTDPDGFVWEPAPVTAVQS